MCRQITFRATLIFHLIDGLLSTTEFGNRAFSHAVPATRNAVNVWKCVESETTTEPTVQHSAGILPSVDLAPSMVTEDFDPFPSFTSRSVSYTVWIIGKQNACKTDQQVARVLVADLLKYPTTILR